MTFLLMVELQASRQDECENFDTQWHILNSVYFALFFLTQQHRQFNEWETQQGYHNDEFRYVEQWPGNIAVSTLLSSTDIEQGEDK